MITRWLNVGVALAAIWLLGFVGSAGTVAGEPGNRPSGVPQEADCWIVVPSTKATMEHIKKLAESFQPGSGMLAEMAIRQSGGPFLLSEAADEAKASLVVFELSKNGGQAKPAWATAWQLRPGADAIAALRKVFGAPIKTEQDIATFVQIQEGALPDKEVFLIARDGRAVLGDSRVLVEKLAKEKPPAAFPADVDFAAGIDLKAVCAKRRQDIDLGLESLQKRIGEGWKLQGQDFSEVDARLFGKTVGILATSRLRLALQEVEQITCWGKFDGDTASFGMGLRAAADGGFAAWLGDLAKAGLPAGDMLPENPVIAIVASYPPKRVDELVADIAKPFSELLSKDGKKRELFDGVTALLGAYVMNSDGSVTMAMSRRRNGSVIAAVNGIKDAALAGEHMNQIYFREASCRHSFKERAREHAGISVSRHTGEYVGKDGQDAADRETDRKFLEALFGLPLVQECAAAKGRLFMAGGKDAAGALDEMLARATGAKPATSSLAGTIKAAPKGAFLAGQLDLGECFGLAMDVQQQVDDKPLNPPVEWGKEQKRQPITWYLSADSQQMNAELRMPIEPVRRLGELVRKTQGDPLPPEPGAKTAPREDPRGGKEKRKGLFDDY